MVQKEEKPNRGFLYYGCLVSFVVLVLAVVLAGLGLWKARNTVLRFTDTQPMVLPETVLAPGEYEALEKRVEAFEGAARANLPAEPLVLTSQEANALIGQNAGLRAFKTRVYINFLDKRVQAAASIPLDSFPLSLFKGRYLNGIGLFNVFMQNGVLIVSPEEISVKGEKVPRMIMDRLRKVNLAKEFYDNVETAKAVSHFKSISVSDGRLVLEVFSSQDPPKTP